MVRGKTRTHEMTVFANEDLANRKLSVDEREAMAPQRLTDNELELIAGGGDPDDGGQFMSRLHQRA
jgi:hypothetical protein